MTKLTESQIENFTIELFEEHVNVSVFTKLRDTLLPKLMSNEVKV